MNLFQFPKTFPSTHYYYDINAHYCPKMTYIPPGKTDARYRRIFSLRISHRRISLPIAAAPPYRLGRQSIQCTVASSTRCLVGLTIRRIVMRSFIEITNICNKFPFSVYSGVSLGQKEGIIVKNMLLGVQ